MGWQDDAIVQAAPAPAPARELQPWEKDAIVAPAQGQQQVAHGLGEAFEAGYQGSVVGLATRQKLPDIVLDAHHAKWYEGLAAMAGQVVGDFPAMVIGGKLGAEGGAVAGGAVGAVAGGVGALPGAAAGGLIGGGAGAFALPTAIRTSLMQAYEKGDVQSASDFLARAGIVIKATAKDALVGAAMGPAGKLGGAVGGTVGRVGATVGTTLAEVGTMTVAPAALEGRLPESQDFINGAILTVGMKGAHLAASRMRNVFAQTGVRPEQVLADSKSDPTIIEDLTKPAEAPVVEAKPGEAVLPEAKPGEAVLPEAKAGEQLPLFADNEIPRAYQPMAEAARAADIVPGIKTEAVADQPFGPVTQVAGEPAQPTAVNYNYMHTPEDAKMALSRLSTVYEAEIQAQRRGTVSWEQTQAEAGAHIADLLGSTEPFAPRAPGTAAGAAELLARKQMLQGAAEDMAVKARAFLDTPVDQRTPHQTAEYLASIERAAMIQAEFLGARAEVGRAMNILKNTKVDARRAEAIQELLSRYGKDPEQLAVMVQDMANPAAALKFAKDAGKATNWQQIVEAWKAGLVSGPVTQVANLMGNLSFAATRPLVDTVAATIGTATRAQERVSFAEPLARVMGNIQGAWDGMSMARVAFMEDVPAGKAEQFQAAIPGKAGYIVRTPFRALSAMDAIFRNMAERGEANAIAARQAAAEGYNPATREFRERMVEITQNFTAEQQAKIAEMGERLVFQAPLGEKARSIQAMVQKTHTEWAVPFIGTPTNVFKEMVRMSPGAFIVGEWRADIAKGGASAQRAFAEMAIGTGISVLASSWAFSGNITGGGDPDPLKRRAQMAAGWQPYSIKFGDKWYSYQRIQPLGTLMGMAADMAQVWEHMTPEESDKLPKMLGMAFSQAVTNTTFLQGITNVTQALADWDRYGPKFLAQMAGSAIPAAVGQTAAMIDPFQREVNSILDAVKNRIPGVRESLSPSRDMFGEEVASTERLGGISPVSVKQISDDPVRKEAMRLGVGAPEAPKTVSLIGGIAGKAGKVQLTEQQRDVFGEASGKFAHQILTPMVNSPGWAYMPDAIKAQAFKEVLSSTHKLGQAKALTPEQRQTEIGRITTEITKKLQPPAQQ